MYKRCYLQESQSLRVQNKVIMKIKSISFRENEGENTFWEITNFLISDVNLIVAKNATGKSRTLNIISHLADLISGRKTVGPKQNYSYKVNFTDKVSTYYEIHIINGEVHSEKLSINDSVKIEKENTGITKTYFDAIDQIVTSQYDPKAISVSQRDILQKPYLEALYEWANNTIHMRFGTQLGQHTFTAYSKEFESNFDYKNTNTVVPYIRMAEVKGKLRELQEAVIKDLETIGYSVSEIGYCDSGLSTPDNNPVHLMYVQESDLHTRTYQDQMSQGMFRATSILVQINYMELSNISSCLLIDDIGEGLDFDRSTALIKILCDKTSKAGSKKQLIMTTNDRFVMNVVPLEYWSVLSRTGQSCQMTNRINSPDIFEDFEFTGLNNFDFFSTGFYKG